MTYEEKRIKIAEKCGWKIGPPLISPSGELINAHYNEAWRLPDYFSDLNACHELHSALTPDQRTEFGWNLYKQVVAQDDASISYSDWIENGNELSVHSLFAVADASASQRAEAFGQTLKLW